MLVGVGMDLVIEDSVGLGDICTMYLVIYVCAGVCVVGLVMCLVVYTRLRLTNTFLCSYSCVPADQECCHGVLTSATAGKLCSFL